MRRGLSSRARCRRPALPWRRCFCPLLAATRLASAITRLCPPHTRQRSSSGSRGYREDLVRAPACDGGLLCDLTPPSCAEFLGARPAALESSESTERHRMRIFASLAHASL